MSRLKWILLIGFMLCAQHAMAFHVTRVTIDGPISPAQNELLEDGLAYASQQSSDLVLLILNTPGGLGESMRNMVSTMLNSDLPVAVWVGPSGARAASAGVFLVAASAVAGMAPQTTIGAASPVGLGGEEISGTMQKKVMNDFSSLVRSVAKAHGRNAEWYEQAVEQSVSITANEAWEKKVVEFIAATPEEFLSQAGQAGFTHKGRAVSFDSTELTTTDFDPGLRYDILSWLLHPQIAYLLMLGGMLGLFIEITHPGTIFPGVVGGLCLLLALYAMSVLPTSTAGLLLIGFSLVLFLLEIKVTSFGLLGVAASASLFIGSVILFRDEYGTIRIPIETIIWPVGIMVGVIGTILYLVTRAQKHAATVQGETMIGLKGRVLNWEGKTGQISVRGEIWAAKGVRSDFTPQPGDSVEIVSQNGLTLEIEMVSR